MQPIRRLVPYWSAFMPGLRLGSFPTYPSVSALSRQISNLSTPSRKQLRNHSVPQVTQKRWKSSTTLSTQEKEKIIGNKVDTPSSKLVGSEAQAASESELPGREQPAYEITFTCKPCQTRSTHKISKQGYHKGTILISCPECKNRHLICDHLNIFRDQSTTIEDILQEKGELIKGGTLGVEGDIELWDDGTTTARTTVSPTSEEKVSPSAIDK